MIEISVLLENTKLLPKLKSKHGLSIAINNKESALLLDVGPDNTFISNALKMNVDIANIDALILSHSHMDHVGGLDSFCKTNKKALIYLFDDSASEYFSKIIGNLKTPVGLNCDISASSRIITTIGNTRIDAKTWFIKNTVTSNRKPEFNDFLYKKIENDFVLDDFSHEGILVIEDDNELVVFNSCSHNGVMNSIESVKNAFGNKKIRSYIGGFHYFNPITKLHENEEQLSLFCEYVQNEKINFYTGHCTGSKCYDFLQSKTGRYMHKIQTGSKIEV